ncbi:hypothetical protein DL93DRAFT_2029154, partial [Clavulina sp. PMI_390]
FDCHFPGCGRSFSGPTGLSNHDRAHYNPKDFPCSWDGCEKIFSTPYDCTRHEATHLKEKQYKCLGYKMAFLRRDQLKQH